MIKIMTWCDSVRRRLSFLLVCLLPSLALAGPPALLNYQGRLLYGTNLVNGSVGLSLRLFNASGGGSPQYEDSNSVTVVDGLYSTFIGDNTTSGSLAAALTNEQVWVEVAVNGAALTPRERLASVGYAVHAWGLSGNSGTLNGHFIGTTDNQPVGIRVNNLQALLITPTNGSPNIVLGSEANVISNGTWGATILGGSNNTIATGARFSVVAGGSANDIGTDSYGSAIGGGYSNNVAVGSPYATIAGGSNNDIGTNSDRAAIGGGDHNNVGAGSWYATIAGGSYNNVGTNASYSTIAGGSACDIGPNAQYAFAAGRRAKANHQGAFVWADMTSADFASTASNQFLIRAGGGVGIGTARPGAALQVESGVQRSERLRLSGQEFFEVSHTDTNGPTLLLGVNRPGNRQLWLADSANLAVNSTNAVLRLFVLGSTPQIDAIATDGATPKDLNLGVGMTIKSNGNVGIGTTAPDSALQVHNSGGPGGSLRIGGEFGVGENILRFGDGDTCTIQGFPNLFGSWMRLNAARVGISRDAFSNKLEVEGDASKTTAGAWLANSDARIKKDIVALTNALSVIDRLHPVRFRYTDDYRARHPSIEDKDYLNFIAQEFREVFPEAVKDSGESGLLQIDTHPAFVHAIAAIQELTKQNAELKARLERLEALMRAK